MGKAIVCFVAAWLASSAHAKDSTELANKRRALAESASFYCAIGRNPITTSDEALQIQPTPQCHFSGPLDTKLDPLSLQPPVLNPRLTITQLKDFLTANGVAVSNDNFQINGASYTIRQRSYKELKDPLFHLHGYPPEWGDTFVTIAANSKQDTATLATFLKSHNTNAIFWRNPHVHDEEATLPRRQHTLPYSPIELVSKCQPIATTPNLLLVGDLHEPAQTQYFLALIQSQKFAWVGLEVDHSQEPIYLHFTQATSPADENADLNFLVRQFPSNVQEKFKTIFRTLKTQGAKVVFINSADEYFNFPFTNVSVHGLIMGARNRVWVRNLPEKWEGTAVLFGGVDHFTNFPGSDFQDFALERYPKLTLNLIDPTETCFRKARESQSKRRNLSLQ